MGIPGLLGALKSVTYPIHVSSYRGLTAGVDAYCWLHRGAFSCGTELCTGVATEKYVAFCMKRVNLLLHHGIQPIMVFDGASLPMKRNMNLERRRLRESAQSKGEAALAAGEAGAAAQHFSKAVGVTHDMAFQFMKALRQAGVHLIVAPYEADAQLAFLSRTGAVDVVITEDSDCLPYGCKKVLFKMDNEGHGQEIQLRNLAANTPLSLCNWKNSMFLDLCLLVGCDYITASIKGLGIATAHRLVDSHRSLEKVMSAVNSSKFVVPEGYWEQYKRARVTFRHHIIYNPQTETTMHLMPLGDTAKQLADLHFLGTHLQPPVAQGVANGWLLPTSHQPYETSAPPEDFEARPSAPLRKAKMRPPDAHNPTPAAAVDDTGVSGDILCGQDGGLELSSETGGGAQRAAQVPLSRAFIDNPFCARRPVLRELPFAGPAGTGWDVASTDTAAAWETQESHQPPESTGERRHSLFPGSFREGDDSGRSGLEEARQRFGLETQDPLSLSGISPDKTQSLWPSVPCLKKNEGGMGGIPPRWREGHGTRNPDQLDEGVDWRKPVWGESGDEGKEMMIDVRRDGGKTNTNYPHQDDSAFRGSDGAKTSTDQEVDTRQGGALALMGEPFDADQAKFVPASAQDFNSTQVSRGLETLHRRKRRLYPAGDTDCPELPRKQPHEAEPNGGDDQVFEDNQDADAEGAAWMVQAAEPETSDDSRGKGISFFSRGSSHDPPAPLRHRSPASPARGQVLTASSRRWTLPSTNGIPPVNGVQLPLLRLLDGQGRSSGTRASQPLPKRTRGIDFWDAQLLR